MSKRSIARFSMVLTALVLSLRASILHAEERRMSELQDAARLVNAAIFEIDTDSLDETEKAAKLEVLTATALKLHSRFQALNATSEEMSRIEKTFEILYQVQRPDIFGKVNLDTPDLPPNMKPGVVMP